MLIQWNRDRPIGDTLLIQVIFTEKCGPCNRIYAIICRNIVKSRDRAIGEAAISGTDVKDAEFRLPRDTENTVQERELTDRIKQIPTDEERAGGTIDFSARVSDDPVVTRLVQPG